MKTTFKKITIGAAAIILLGLLEFIAGFNHIFDFVGKHRFLVGVFTGPGPLQAAFSENMFLNKMNWFYWMPDIWQYWVRPFGTFIGMIIKLVPTYQAKNVDVILNYSKKRRDMATGVIRDRIDPFVGMDL